MIEIFRFLFVLAVTIFIGVASFNFKFRGNIAFYSQVITILSEIWIVYYSNIWLYMLEMIFVFVQIVMLTLATDVKNDYDNFIKKLK